MGHNNAIELRHEILSMLQATSACLKPHEKPSILWYMSIFIIIRNQVEVKKHEYSKRSKGSSIIAIQGINDTLFGLKYSPQSSLENVVIKKFVRFYTKRAEEFPIILKNPLKVRIKLIPIGPPYGFFHLWISSFNICQIL